MTTTAKLDAPTDPFDEPLPESPAASAGLPAPEAEPSPAIDNELVSELELALQTVLTRASRPAAAAPVEAVGQPEASGDIWYGSGAAAPESAGPLLLRPAEQRPAPERELDTRAAEDRPEAQRRRRLPLRAALCLAGVLGIAGAGGVALTFVAAADDEEAPLLARQVRTETIRAAAMDRQPETERAPMSEENAAVGAALAETPADEVTLLRPVGESRASVQPAERLPLAQGQPQAGAEAAAGSKAPDRLVQAPAPAVATSAVANGPEESRVRMIAPAAPGADGASQRLSSGLSAAADEEIVAAMPTPLGKEELVARTGVAAEADPAGTAAPDETGGADQPDMQPQSALAEPAGGDAAAEAGAAEEATRSAPVTSAVNMRAGPDNDAAVLTVVPAGSEVNVIACEHWCEVVFAGERGWIYKSFVRGADS